jgi:titin
MSRLSISRKILVVPLLFLGMATAFVPSAALASGAVNVEWTANADTDLWGYRVYYSSSTSLVSLSTAQASADASVTRATIVNATSAAVTGLSLGPAWRIRLTALDISGNESAFNVDSAGADVELSTALASAPPAAPSGLSAAASGTGINVNWTDNADDETSYEVERCADGVSFAPLSLTPGLGANADGFSDAGLTPGTTYTYRVRAVNGLGNSDYSLAAAAAAGGGGPTPPAAPSSLTATAASVNRIDLAWTDSSGDQTGFLIERLTGGGPFVRIATTSAAAVAYSDTGLFSGAGYTYRVSAVNEAGASSALMASASTLDNLPAAPGALRATSVAPARVVLAWADNSENESGFVIERAAGGGAFVPIATTVANAVSYSDTHLTAEAATLYRVRAVNAAGDSPPSNEVSVLVPAAAPPSSPVSRKFVTPAHPMTFFGPEAREVVIRDMAGREVFHASGDGAAPIVWNARREDGRMVESGAYIARIVNADGSKRYQTLVVAK